MDIQLDLWEIALAVGAPFILAVVEIFHPHPHDLLKVDLPAWLFVHYAQILLFPLSALAVATLVKRQTGVAATICRLSMFVFGVAYTAFDTAAGLVTGILVKAAHLSGRPDTWRPAIDAVWTHPIVGGAPAPLFAVLGSVALSIGAVAAAVIFKRSGNSWTPVLLLVISSFGIAVFRTHAWPGGPLTFGGIALASAWLLWEKRARTAAP
jgi:uncharacterized protein YhhL (DUF1145 family)